MLRLSKLADYATVIMVYLTRHPDRLHTAKAIADQVHLGAPTVSKLLKLLAINALLKSQRGTKGGYQLARPPQAISVAQIIASVEGDGALTECSLHGGECSLEPVCAIRTNWQMISDTIYKALDSVTLAQLAQPLTRQAIDVTSIKTLATRRETS